MGRFGGIFMTIVAGKVTGEFLRGDEENVWFFSYLFCSFLLVSCPFTRGVALEDGMALAALEC